MIAPRKNAQHKGEQELAGGHRVCERAGHVVGLKHGRCCELGEQADDERRGIVLKQRCSYAFITAFRGGSGWIQGSAPGCDTNANADRSI